MKYQILSTTCLLVLAALPVFAGQLDNAIASTEQKPAIQFKLHANKSEEPAQFKMPSLTPEFMAPEVAARHAARVDASLTDQVTSVKREIAEFLNGKHYIVPGIAH